MYKFQDLTPISGHFRTNFKISGISGQRPGLQYIYLSNSLTFMLYVTEVMPSSEHSLWSLDRCVRQVVGKIFATRDNNCIEEIRRFCDLSDVGALTERRRVKFVDKMLSNGQSVFLVWREVVVMYIFMVCNDCWLVKGGLSPL